MDLKIGGSNVGKIMYNGQEFGGAAKLEPGTILYMSETPEKGFENVHLLSTTKNWNNLNGIKVRAYDDPFVYIYFDADIPSDNFKNVDINKPYKTASYTDSVNISTSIVDGEYRLNAVSTYPLKLIVKAI